MGTVLKLVHDVRLMSTHNMFLGKRKENNDTLFWLKKVCLLELWLSVIFLIENKKKKKNYIKSCASLQWEYLVNDENNYS